MPNFVSTITETWTGDTGTVNSTKTLTVGSIVDVTKRVANITTTEVTLAQFAAAVNTSGQAHDVNEVKYVRITNLDSNINLLLGVIGAATCTSLVVGPGESRIFGATDDTFLAEADTDPSHTSHADIATIEGKSASSTIAVEIVIASEET
mgnify:CR=1 FL=1